jgi:hypothetical protein
MSTDQIRISRTPHPTWKPLASPTSVSQTAPTASQRAALHTGSEPWKGYMPLSEARKAVGYTEQIIPNWLPDTGVSFIIGRRGDGKTLVLIDQALCFATDRDWMGIPTLTGWFAVYVCGEFPAGTLSLAEAWHKRNGVDPTDPNTRFMFVPRSVDLMKREDCEALVRYLKEALPPEAKPIIYIDTWQRATATGGQSEDTDMQLAMTNAEYIEKALGGPVIAAAHPPKGKGKVLTILGSIITENRSAAIWQIERLPKTSLNDPRRKLSVIRNKSGGEGSSISLRILKVEIDGTDNHGKPRTGAVIVQDAAISKQKRIELSGPDKGSATSSDQPLSENESALLCQLVAAPKLSFVKLAEALGWQGATGKPNESRVKNTMGKLADHGLVTKDPDGSYYPTEAGQKIATTLPKQGDHVSDTVV